MKFVSCSGLRSPRLTKTQHCFDEPSNQEHRMKLAGICVRVLDDRLPSSSCIGKLEERPNSHQIVIQRSNFRIGGTKQFR